MEETEGKPAVPENMPLLFDVVELLDNFDGDREFAVSILGEALQELPNEVKMLGELAQNDDARPIRHQAHTMKGLAANICTPALKKICHDIEIAADEGQLASVRKLLPELERTAMLTAEAIREKINA